MSEYDAWVDALYEEDSKLEPEERAREQQRMAGNGDEVNNRFGRRSSWKN